MNMLRHETTMTPNVTAAPLVTEEAAQPFRVIRAGTLAEPAPQSKPPQAQNLAIISAAIAKSEEDLCGASILLCDGEVAFRTGPNRQVVEFSSEDYDALWHAVSALEFTHHGVRADGLSLIPEALQPDWQVQVYFGPNFYRKMNAVINLYRVDPA